MVCVCRGMGSLPLPSSSPRSIATRRSTPRPPPPKVESVTTVELCHRSPPPTLHHHRRRYLTFANCSIDELTASVCCELGGNYTRAPFPAPSAPPSAAPSVARVALRANTTVGVSGLTADDWGEAEEATFLEAR